MKKLLAAIVVFAVVATPALGFAGSKQIRFDSSPQGATIYVDGAKACVTPCAAEVQGRWWYEKCEHIIEARKQGYAPAMTTIKAEMPNVGGIVCGFLCLFPFLWALETPDVVVLNLQPK